MLSVRDLAVSFPAPGGRFAAVAGVEFDVPAGATLALVGESGSGKSLTALAVMGLLPPAARVDAGRIELAGVDLLTRPPGELRRLRGDRVAMIFQEPMTCLNPVMPVGEQVGEALRVHRGASRRMARQRARDLLEQVGIHDAAQRLRAYPHELSGGMRQRVMIAAALVCEPQLLIADEPTTALDVTVQAQILDLLRQLQRTRRMAMLFITHDLAVVSELADAVCVMYRGRIVERGPVAQVLHAPTHPYTQTLLRCTPTLD